MLAGIQHEIGNTKVPFFLHRCRSLGHRTTFPFTLFTIQTTLTGDKSQEFFFFIFLLVFSSFFLSSQCGAVFWISD